MCHCIEPATIKHPLPLFQCSTTEELGKGSSGGIVFNAKFEFLGLLLGGKMQNVIYYSFSGEGLSLLKMLGTYVRPISFARRAAGLEEFIRAKAWQQAEEAIDKEYGFLAKSLLEIWEKQKVIVEFIAEDGSSFVPSGIPLPAHETPFDLWAKRRKVVIERGRNYFGSQQSSPVVNVPDLSLIKMLEVAAKSNTRSVSDNAKYPLENMDSIEMEYRAGIHVGGFGNAAANVAPDDNPHITLRVKGNGWHVGTKTKNGNTYIVKISNNLTKCCNFHLRSEQYMPDSLLYQTRITSKIFIKVKNAVFHILEHFFMQ